MYQQMLMRGTLRAVGLNELLGIVRYTSTLVNLLCRILVQGIGSDWDFALSLPPLYDSQLLVLTYPLSYVRHLHSLTVGCNTSFLRNINIRTIRPTRQHLLRSLRFQNTFSKTSENCQYDQWRQTEFPFRQNI